ncbi:MAG: hypothetical protein R3F11_31190 [Verrucomicrobiales bacterium]
MKQAPLQLADYWAVSTHVDANPAFKNEEPVSLSFDSIKVRHGIKQLESEQPKNDGTRWLVDLTVEQGIGDGGTVPYSFTLKMQGIVLASSRSTGRQVDPRCICQWDHMFRRGSRSHTGGDRSRSISCSHHSFD